jgi:hypothetical protein
MFYSLVSNEYLHANLCEYFKANMKRMMRTNGVGEYTETCGYEANKIHIRLGSLQSEYKKNANTAHSIPTSSSSFAQEAF